MSNAYITWARKDVRGLTPLQKLVLVLIADEVDDEGSWRISIAELADQVEKTRNTTRDALDRLAELRLLVFRCERYRGNAQAAHRIQLIREPGQLARAYAEGYSNERSTLDRTSLGADGGTAAQISPQKLTEGGSISSPRVGQLVDPHITPQKALRKPLQLARAICR